MNFTPTEIEGVVRIGLTPHRDERGFFARVYCLEEFAAAGLAFTPKQMNL